MRIAYIRPNETTLHVVRMRDSLERWYELIQCRVIEVHPLDKLSKVIFICDEEGKLKDKIEPNIIWHLGRDILTGTIAFVHDAIDDDSWSDLTDEDIEYIRRYLTDNLYPNEYRDEDYKITVNERR